MAAARNPALRLPVLATALCLALGAGNLQAQSLSQLLEQARGFDAQWQAQQAEARAAQSRADQARAGLLPSVGLQAGASRAHVDMHLSHPYPAVPGSVNASQQNLQLSAQQPLYRPASKLAYEQGQRGADAARAQLSGAEQGLMVRVAQAYFDTLAAQDDLEVARAQKRAIGRQLEAARRNFDVGAATITDAREAQARLDLIAAQEIAAANELQIRRVALDQLVGTSGAQPWPLAQALPRPPMEPADGMQAWVDTGLANQPQIRQAQLALDIARLETEKARAGHKPTVDLQAAYAVNRYPDGSMTPSIPIGYRSNTASIGVVMNMPLFAGFAVQNRIAETVAQEEKAQAQLADARRGVEQAVRTAYLGVQSAQAQAQALQTALESSRTSLEANQLGYEVGVRINIDVLNAQQQLFETRRALLRARYDTVMAALKLKAASGTLGVADIETVNRLLLQTN